MASFPLASVLLDQRLRPMSPFDTVAPTRLITRMRNYVHLTLDTIQEEDGPFDSIDSSRMTTSDLSTFVSGRKNHSR